MSKLKTFFLTLVAIVTFTSCFACNANQNSTSSGEGDGLIIEYDDGLNNDQTLESLSNLNKQQFYFGYVSFADYVNLNSEVISGKSYLTLDPLRKTYCFKEINLPTYAYFYDDNKTTEVLYATCQQYYEPQFVMEDEQSASADKLSIASFGYTFYSYGFEASSNAFVYKHFLTVDDSQYTHVTYVLHAEQVVAKFFYKKVHRNMSFQYVEQFLTDYCKVNSKDNIGYYEVEQINAEELLPDFEAVTHNPKFEDVQTLQEYKGEGILNGEYLILNNEESSYYYLMESQTAYLISYYKGEIDFDNRGNVGTNKTLYEYTLYSYDKQIDKNVPLTFKYALSNLEYPFFGESDGYYDCIENKLVLIYQKETLIAVFNYKVYYDTLGFLHFSNFLMENLTIFR